jgi:diguanylate cyclase (GGDEF)-like protein
VSLLNNKKIHFLLILIIISLIGSFFAFLQKEAIYYIIAVAVCILILELGRILKNTNKLLITSILCTVLLAVLAPGSKKYSSLLILPAPIPYSKTQRKIQANKNQFNQIKKSLEIKQEKIEKSYKRTRKISEQRLDEINRLSKLYELSNEIEEALSSEEIAAKSLEFLNLRIHISKLAFYKYTPKGYILLKRKNVSEKIANAWLADIEEPSVSDKKPLYQFKLKAGRKNMGLIICKGNLTNRQKREAEVLIHQIILGYEKITLYERVKELSRIDGLTGLYLRMYFLERLNEELKRAKREGYKIAFIMADLDDFKKYNDTFGHPIGDKLLMQVANIINSSIYSSDFAGRYGGEEFCIYMPMAGPKETIKKAEKIRKLVEKNTPVSISMGISYFPDHANNAHDMIRTADEALYKAKEQGKNLIHEFNG